MRASAAVGTGALLVGASRAAGNSLEGYAAASSVTLGGTLDFFVRDPQALGAGTTLYPVTITRVSAPDVFVTSFNANIGNQVVPPDATSNGCRWLRSFQLSIPNTWPPGLYYAFIGSGANATTVPFVVRPVAATPGVQRLVMIPVTTVHAYNEYGGKSLYDFNSTGQARASQVSLDRPLSQTFNSFFDVYSQYFVRWLAKNNVAADFCTDLDIVANPALLDPYQLYMQAGHDEYWTRERRQTMDAFVARGGNAMYLGGNTSWFQIRLEAGNGNGVPNRSIVCYKDATADPETNPALKTINFAFLATPYPENATTGLGFVKGCSWAGSLPRPLTPTVVLRPEHWAFAGTALAQGAGFGGSYVGYESDAADFVLGSADQRAYPTGADGSPASLRILASADASNWNALSIAAGGGGELSGYAMVSVFSRGGGAGTVFNGGSTDWAYGLRPELDGLTPTPISQITRNVLNKLSLPWAESADVRQWRSVVGSTPNYFYSTSTAAPAGTGMVLETVGFSGFLQAVVGSVPVYRFRGTGSNLAQRTYLLSLSPVAPGAAGQFAADGIAFHAYAAPRSDATAIYEHFAFNTSLQLATAFYSSLATPPAGFNAGPIRFYAPSLGSVPTPLPAPTFALATAAVSLSAERGQTVSTAITVAAQNGFAGVVNFATTGLPAGVVASFTPAASATGTSLALAVAASTLPGPYTVTVVGTAPATASSAALTKTLSLALLVTAPVALPAFTLTAGKPTLFSFFGLIFGESVSIRIGKLNGFSGEVTFSVSGLPNRALALFSPSRSSSATVMTVIATDFRRGAQRGTFTLTIRGTSGGLSASTTVLLTCW